jgi:hypothetical protein
VRPASVGKFRADGLRVVLTSFRRLTGRFAVLVGPDAVVFGANRHGERVTYHRGGSAPLSIARAAAHVQPLNKRLHLGIDDMDNRRLRAACSLMTNDQ